MYRRSISHAQRATVVQVYLGRSEREAGDGTAMVQRDMAVHCRQVIVSCTVVSRLARVDLLQALQTILHEVSRSSAQGRADGAAE